LGRQGWVREPDIFVYRHRRRNPTIPDYKAAPFIRVVSEIDGVDMVTVGPKGIFSYCGVKVKDRHDVIFGPEKTANRPREGRKPSALVTDGRNLRLADCCRSVGVCHHMEPAAARKRRARHLRRRLLGTSSNGNAGRTHHRMAV